MGKYYDTGGAIAPLMIGTTFDTATTTLADKACARAETEINKYICKRYDVSNYTFTTSPPLLYSLCDDLSVGYMYLAMGRGSKESFTRAKMYMDPAMLNLREIRDYKGDLYDTSGSIIADSSNGSYYAKSTTEDYDNIFDLDDPIKWRIDSDQSTAISDDRE